MNPKLVVCPNCGAYVLSSDNICPRCDYPLNTPAPQPVTVAEIERSPEDTPANGATGPLHILTPDLDTLEEIDRSMLPTTELPAVPEFAPVADDGNAAEAETEFEGELELEDEEEPGETLLVGPQIDEPALDEDDLDIPLELDLEGEPTPMRGTPVDVEPPAFMVEKTEPNLAWVVQPGDSDVPHPGAGGATSPGSAASPGELVPPDAELPPIRDDSKPFWPLPKKVLPYEEPTLTQLPVADEDDWVTQARIPTEEDELAPYIVPPAPFSPPPDDVEEAEPPVAPPPFVQAPPQPVYTPPPAPAYTPAPSYYAPPAAQQYAAPGYGYAAPAVPLIAQRIQSYVSGGYRLRSQNPRQAVLSYGKHLGVGTWIVALFSIIGVLWYVLLLALSGFRQDRAYLDVSPDGRLYEEGPGAAHVRTSRARSGRRWSLLGMVLFLLSLVLLIGLLVTAGLLLSQDRYQAALRKAYPEVTYFENNFSDEEAAQDDIDLMKTGAVVFSILGGIAVVGVWGGFTLWVIGQVHSSAYRVYVPPLPGYE